MRSAAALALKDMGSAKAADVEPLHAALPAKAPETRLYAAEALSDVGPEAKPAVPALTALLKDADAKSRLAAVRVLGNTGPEAAPDTAVADGSAGAEAPDRADTPNAR